MHRIHKTIDEFMQTNEEPSKQIISLGAGFDTTYFLLKHKYPDSQFTYIEIDFPDICMEKSARFRASPELSEIIGANINPEEEIITLGYKLLHGDIRDYESLEQKLRNFTLQEGPTLIIAECVFSYIDSDRINGLISSISGLFINAAFIIYDIIGPNDAFGRTMIQNLSARGINLRGITKYPTVDSQVQRFKNHFQNVQGFDMLQIYNTCVDANERTR